MTHSPAASTLIRLHLEMHGLKEREDYRLHNLPEGALLLSFSTQTTSNLLQVHGSVDKILAFVTVPSLEAGNVHLNLQMELRPAGEISTLDG